MENEFIKAGYFEEDPFDRTKRYFGEKKFHKLRTSSVLVVGAGAVGNEVCKNLALLGIDDIKLVDFDKVTKSNLNRCVFFRPEDHNKMYKVYAIQKRLQEISDTRIDAYPVRIEEAPEDVWDVDLIIVGVDDNYARYFINSKNLSLDNPKPIINGAMGQDFVQVDVLYPPYTACLVCPWSDDYTGHILSRQVKQKCDEYFIETVSKFPTISFATSLVGAIIAIEAVKLLTINLKKEIYNDLQRVLSITSLGKSIIYNFQKQELKKIRIMPNPKCNEPLCIKRREDIITQS